MSSSQDIRAAIERRVGELLSNCRLADELRDEARHDFVAHIVTDVEVRRRRGVHAGEALEQALRRFGDADEIRRHLRLLQLRRSSRVPKLQTTHGPRIPNFHSLLTDLRYGLRNLRAAPGLTAVALLTIALGVGANSAIFTILNGVLLRPLPYPNAEELVRVWPEKFYSEAMLVEMSEQTRSYAGLSTMSATALVLRSEGGDTQRILGAVVTADHLTVLGGRPLLGRGIEADDQRAGGEAALVLSHGFWQRQFGADPDILGKSIDFGGLSLARRTVVGVMPATFRPLSADTQFWVPFITDSESDGFQSAYGNRVIGRLAPGVSVQQAAAELRRLVPEFTERHPTQFREVRYSPIDVVPMLETMVADVRPTLLLLAGAVGFVLLIACTNVANLLLARASARQAELAIRAALGAERGRLVRQLLTESTLLGVLGGGFGLLVGIGILTTVADSIPNYLPRTGEIRLDAWVLAFTATLSLVSGVIFGVAPAFRATRVNPRAVLVDGSRSATGGRGRQRLNQGLVALEIALSLVLVVGSALMMKSFAQLRDVDPGFDVDNLAMVRIVFPAERYNLSVERGAFIGELLERFEALPGVQRAAAASLVPMGDSNSGIPYRVEGQELPEGTSSMVANFRRVTPSYFSTVGLRLIRGRLLEEADREETAPVVVINEAMVRQHFPDQDPVGRRFLDTDDGSELFTVVGVVSDIRQHRLDLAPRPEFYVSTEQAGWNVGRLLVRVKSDPGGILPELRTTVRAMDADILVLELQTMPQRVRETMGDARFITGVFSAFAAVAALLGIIGVYGVVSYTTGQRSREIGLRVALGATSRGVVMAVVKRAMVPVVLGVVTGLGLALLLSRLLSSLLFDVSPTDPVVYAVVAGFLALVGVAASLPPARRAACIDPIVALRSE